MDKQRKQELKAQYLQMKPEMGILYLRCIPSGQIYLKAVADTKGKLNGLKQRLDLQMYLGDKNKKIQEEWRGYGESQFEMKVIDILDYEQDETMTDYSEELEMLLEDWCRKLVGAMVIV